MDINHYDLPIDDLVAIDRTALQLVVALHNGETLSNEQRDWLDYANNVLRDSAKG